MLLLWTVHHWTAQQRVLSHVRQMPLQLMAQETLVVKGCQRPLALLLQLICMETPRMRMVIMGPDGMRILQVLPDLTTDVNCQLYIGPLSLVCVQTRGHVCLLLLMFQPDLSRICQK